MNIGLQQRLAAGQFYQGQFIVDDCGFPIRIRLGQAVDFGNNFFQSLLSSLGEGVGGVAVGAAEVTESQADEDAGPTRPGALALHRMVYFIDR